MTVVPFRRVGSRALLPVLAAFDAAIKPPTSIGRLCAAFTRGPSSRFRLADEGPRLVSLLAPVDLGSAVFTNDLALRHAAHTPKREFGRRRLDPHLWNGATPRLLACSRMARCEFPVPLRSFNDGF